MPQDDELRGLGLVVIVVVNDLVDKEGWVTIETNNDWTSWDDDDDDDDVFFLIFLIWWYRPRKTQFAFEKGCTCPTGAAPKGLTNLGNTCCLADVQAMRKVVIFRMVQKSY